jgi:predicted nucleic acid-binding protein
VIVLDTNIVSEAMRRDPSPELVAWSATVHPGEIYLTAITRAEIRYGIERLPAGKRRKALAAKAERHLAAFSDRTLPFDNPAADLYGLIVAERERAGRPISHEDAQIAAIARARGATVATRDTAGFDGVGLRIVNPFEKGSPT